MSKKPAIDKFVFWPALIVIVALTSLLAINKDTAGPVMDKIMSAITYKFDWAFEFLTVGLFVITLWLIFGKYGSVKLGGLNDTPEFSNFSWGAMLFCAGMGTSIMFWSMMEPMYYYIGPPFGIEPKTPQAAEWAVAYGLFHWGISAWTLYALPTVTIAYSYYVKKRPSLRISTACEGLFGKYTDGWVGKVIDILIIWSLVGGLGTSLGLGVPMVSATIGEIFGVGQSFGLSVVIILIWSAIYGTSAYFGLYKGIKKLSDINVYLALILAAFVFLVGPTIFLLSYFTDSLGLMLQNIVRMSFYTDPINKGGFPQGWTVFYWAWFAATAPFMALFVARISRGRTIKALLSAILLWGTLGSWLYFAVFGGYAVHLETTGVLSITNILSDQGGPAAVVAILKTLPAAKLVLIFFAVLAFIFLATSLDSATYILSAIATEELRDDEEPARWHRLLWAGILAAMAISLLVIGGLRVVQTSTVFVSVPVIFIYIFLLMSLLNWLKRDHGQDLASKIPGEQSKIGG